jgi:predicted nucleic acid-binding protein
VYILDTDVVTLFFHHRNQQPILVSRVLATSPERLWISVITAEEMIQGAFKLIRHDQRKGKGTGGYALLARILQDIPSFQILPFNDQANLIYKAMPAAIKRLGSADCRIAASAIAYGYTVITRNARDFGQIPNVKFEDWTA